jgi:hypothetical protein
MKFKSAEADWNISFVSQHVEGRNPGGMVARKLYRRGELGLGVLDRRWESEAGSGEDLDEEISEVCCRFLDECVPDDGVDGDGPDHVDDKGEEEGHELDVEHCARRERDQLWPTAERDGYCAGGLGRYVYDADGDSECSAEHDAAHRDEDDGSPRQTLGLGTAGVVKV